jgi:hypothetical protein
MSRLDRTRRILFALDETIAGTVYGTIIVMGAVVAEASAGKEPRELAILVAATVVAVWLGFVYAHGLANSIDAGRRVTITELGEIARRELSIPLAAVGPIAALVLGASGLVYEAAAIWLALSIGLAILVIQGLRYARVEHLGPAGTLVAVAVNLAIGLLIVMLKAVAVP